MSVTELTDLLRVLIWPAVVVVAVILLRRELGALVGRVREIEGPGSIKVTLNPATVEQIIERARRENTPPAAITEQILRSAKVLDPREARILRALFDDHGRAIYNYQSAY